MVDIHFLEVSGSPYELSFFFLSDYKDFFGSSEHKFVAFLYGFVEKGIQYIPSSRFFFHRNFRKRRTLRSNLRFLIHRIVFSTTHCGSRFSRQISFSFRNFLFFVSFDHFCRSCSFTRGVSCDESEIEITDFEGLDGFLELFLGFSGETYDDISRNPEERITSTKVFDLESEILESMLSIHILEHFIRTGLKSEMKIMAHFRKFEMSRENISGHIVRITGSEANAIKSFDTIDSFEKFPERSFFRRNIQRSIPLELFTIPEFFLGFFSVAVDVLSEKGYFLGSVSYTFLHFFQYLILWS